MKKINLKQIFAAFMALLLMLTILNSCDITDDSKTYEISDFDAFFDRYVALLQADALFAWDMETGGTAEGAMEARGKTVGIISAELYDISISQDMQNFFKTVEKAMEKGEVDEKTKSIYRITKSDYDKAMAIPKEEYQAFSEMTTVSYSKWHEAKEKNDYNIFEPYLQDIIDYNRKVIEYRKQAGMEYENPYDALLDDFEPGLTTKTLDGFFDELRSEILPLLKSIKESNKEIRTDFLQRKIPLSIQKDISEFLMKTTGFDMNRGILAESAHPMTIGIGQSDVRITTRYTENDFAESFYAVMHESGHAIYEQNVAKELESTILDTGVSMGIHESQSRFLENMVGRSYEFWEAIYDDFQKITKGHFEDVSALQFYEALNVVEPSFIRIQADELTYSLHIMVRYEIEKEIANNPELTAKDLPGLWDEKMLEYLGITPESYAEGILQDSHWSFGEFGYFPTYAIGNAYAAQFTNAMEKDFDLKTAISELDFTVINNWSTEKIHKHGSMLQPFEILSNITDEDFSSKYYIDYLKQKYTELYGI